MKKRLLLIAVIIVWMGVIFFFSSADSGRSGEASGRLTGMIQRIAYPDWSELPAEEYRYQMAGLSFFVRKMAHLTEFFILGVLVSLLMSTYEISWLFRVLITVGIGAAYAVSDEIHQFFVVGRDMRIFDMMIDTLGITVGALIAARRK